MALTRWKGRNNHHLLLCQTELLVKINKPMGDKAFVQTENKVGARETTQWSGALAALPGPVFNSYGVS